MDGNSTGRVFHATSNIVVRIENLTITNGYATRHQSVHRLSPLGGGIYSDHASLTVSNCILNGNSANYGGAVYVKGGTLTIDTSTLSGNDADHGGAVYVNGGILAIDASTLSLNSATYFGGGIYNHGGAKGIATLRIHNSTLSGNAAKYDVGGAIFNRSGADYPGATGSATVQILNCTLSGNSPGKNVLGGGIYNRGFRYGRATLEIGSTILEAGTKGRNIFNRGGKVNSHGYNLSSDRGSGFLTTASDRLNTDPLLDTLADNGGPTFTHALLKGSPAIDAGINFAETYTDQRGAGFARLHDDPSVPNGTGGDATDIGAFEGGEVEVKEVNYFPNGVAAGDVSQFAAMLWARAATTGTVWFEYGTDPSFTCHEDSIAQEVTDSDVPAKLLILNLQAGTQYYYRALFGPSPLSPEALASAASGKFRTPFSDGSHGLRFGVSSCWNSGRKPYVSIRNVPERDLDFFVALGDTVYADLKGKANLGFSRKQYRDNFAPEFTPDDNFFALARASAGFYATIDDHEVNNNFSGGAPPENKGGALHPNYVKDPSDQKKPFYNETSVYKQALHAFHEYWPIREGYYGVTPARVNSKKRKLYRYRTFGNDAAFFLLDARSFRDKAKTLGYTEGVSMLSAWQRNEFLQDLKRAHNDGITWKFVLISVPIQNLAVLPANDRFEAYAWERSKILDYVVKNNIKNVVFISGDIHGTIANDLLYQNSVLGLPRATNMWEITTGPVGHKALFANLLGVFPQSESLRTVENDLFRLELNILQGFWPKIGLSGTTYDPHPARLLQGQYLSINTYGWTEFEIKANKTLRVTTWGVYYIKDSEVGEIDVDSARSHPYIVSQFEVTPL